MRLCLCTGLALLVCVASGCSSGGSMGTGGGGGTSQTPGMGTLTAMSDTDTYTLTNAASSMVLGIAAQSQIAGANVAQEPSSTTTADINWHFIPMNSNQYNIENILTHQVVGISNASTSAGAQVLQWADNGTNDHLWEFYLLKDGNYLVKNVNSSLYLEDAGSGTTSAATIDQGARATTGAGCACQEWTVADTGNAAYPMPETVTVSYAGTDTETIGIHDPSIVQAGAQTSWHTPTLSPSPSPPLPQNCRAHAQPHHHILLRVMLAPTLATWALYSLHNVCCRSGLIINVGQTVT